MWLEPYWFTCAASNESRGSASASALGVLLALVAVVYGALSGWVILPIPHMLAVKWIVSESLLSVVFGLAVAGICKP